jgi:hypothetical protein
LGARRLPDHVEGDALDFCLVVTQRRGIEATALQVTAKARPVDGDRPMLRRTSNLT